MSIKMDKIKTLSALGEAVRQSRKDQGQSATAIASRAGRSRDILYRLEKGQDVSVSALLDILRAAGYAIQLTPAGLPTLEEMRQRFGEPEDAADTDNTHGDAA